MVDMNVKITTPLLQQLKTVGSENGKKNMSRAINDALKSGKAAAKKNTTKIYNIKAKDIESNVKVSKASPGNLKAGKLVFTSRRLTVGTSTHFSITPRAYKSQQGVKLSKRKVSTVTIRKGKKVNVNHAFVANPSAVKGGNTMLWIRLNRGIAPLKTISIPQMVSNDEVYKPTHQAMQEQYEKRFQHYQTLQRNGK